MARKPWTSLEAAQAEVMRHGHARIDEARAWWALPVGPKTVKLIPITSSSPPDAPTYTVVPRGKPIAKPCLTHWDTLHRHWIVNGGGYAWFTVTTAAVGRRWAKLGVVPPAADWELAGLRRLLPWLEPDGAARPNHHGTARKERGRFNAVMARAFAWWVTGSPADRLPPPRLCALCAIALGLRSAPGSQGAWERLLNTYKGNADLALSSMEQRMLPRDLVRLLAS